ncbi:MAG: carboxymuconolactone decarboxylase family protein [Candidatus Delongbacteria bacterium]|nr:carboxymuconolactone decarboxylase family protein [Candidatus Delongbacteria bacterium]
MAFIKYLKQDEIPEQNRVKDLDNIIQIHSVHSKVMKQHYEMYLEIMRKRSPLSKAQREMVAIVVSLINECHY